MSTEFTGSMEMSREIIRFAPKAGQKTTGGRNLGQNKILTCLPQHREKEYQVPRRNIQRKHLRKDCKEEADYCL
jgi:hypothetical protein